jgi:threonine dehydratase
MRIHSDLADTIGNTPLLKLKRASEMTGCTILGKCEFLNPGQSVKDRAALFMIRDAVAKRGNFAPAAPLSKARPAIPASVWRWWVPAWASRPSSSFLKPKARKRRT